MVKRKKADDEDLDEHNSVPLPIQTFLWRQTNPFIRPKLSKLCDASCVSFERVLVQNILHGLSPSLCEAIQEISRWALIKASFSHIMHCCAAVLNHRKQNHPTSKFDSNETKLLYTLSWVILDAASECEDLELERTGGAGPLQSYMFTLDMVQLFVYLFGPLISSLHESDFQTLKLENGLRLWQPLWEYRQPQVPCFAAFVKPKRNLLKASRNVGRVNFNTANIYVGKGTSAEDIYLGIEDDGPSSRCSFAESVSPQCPLARMSDICHLSTTTETQSTSVEVVCEVCNNVMQNNKGQHTCTCGNRRGSSVSVEIRSLIKRDSPIDKEFMTKHMESVIAAGLQGNPSPDMLSASYFDVAVLRCLFCPQWVEEGMYWALRYIHQRLLEVCDDMNRVEHVRERSKSLPIPDPVSCMTPSQTSPSSPPSPRCEAEAEPDSPQKHKEETRKEPSFKRMRVTELKNIFEGKVKQLRRRESQEAFDVESQKSESGQQSPELWSGTESPLQQRDRASSTLGRLMENEEDSYDINTDSGESSSDSTQKTPPVVSKKQSQGDAEEDTDDNGKEVVRKKHSLSRRIKQEFLSVQKPIITITEDSPEPSPLINWRSSSKRPSTVSQKSGPFQELPLPAVAPASGTGLQRSMTDSDISYHKPPEVQEVPGSVFYIQKDGQLNYRVVLQACRTVASRTCSARSCGTLLNILNCLLDLGIIEKKEKSSDKEKKDKEPAFLKEKDMKEKGKGDEKNDKKNNDGKRREEKEEILTSHAVAMETVIRIFQTLGCPHGCGDGVRGSLGDHLRAHGMSCLTRLQRIHPTLFRQFLRQTLIKRPLQELVDFLHALLGFCLEPSGRCQSPLGRRDGKTGYSNNFGEPLAGGNSVDGQIIYLLFKPLVTRFVESRKEMEGHENIGLYCDIRQLMNFVKETCGGTFRIVALSGLMDAISKEKMAGTKAKKTKIVRRTWSVTSESGDERGHAASPASEDSGNAKTRRSLFKRKTKKVAKMQMLPPYGGASDSEIIEEGGTGKLSPRVSMSAAEDDPPSGSSTPKRKFSKFNIAWRRSTKSDHEGDDSACETPIMDSKRSHDTLPSQPPPEAMKPRPKGRMSFKAASQATLSFLSARKRIEDGLRNWSKRRTSKRGSVDEGSRRGSLGMNDVLKEVVIIRERKLVNSYAVKSGMMRFNFMLDCCQPGAIPDPHLVAALLDLEAPVVARAALLLECAHFVSRCNHGDWPNWMKLNLPGFRQTGLLHSRGQPSGYRRNVILQRAAGRLFHMWGEAIANRMYDILKEETPDKFTIIHQVRDDNKKRELRVEDEEEDFLDEATVNHTGTDCPYALKMVACQLLLEITTFLRETHQYIPKAKIPRRDGWDKHVSSRRWSSVLSSPGQSERSNSRSSQGDLMNPIGMVGSPSDRKISFAVLGQTERSDSIGSSNTSISQADITFDAKGRRVGGKNKLLKMRRGSGHNSSFGNRSFKLKRGDAGGSGSLRLHGSMKARKVSTQSLKSDRSDEEHSGEVEPPPDILSGDDQESPDDVDEMDYAKYMPWIKVVVQLANTSNFICEHQSFCHPNCYERQRRSCARLMMAITKVYTSTAEAAKQQEKDDKDDSHSDTLRDKLKRRESMFQPSSPTRRRESTPLLDKVKMDINAARAKIAAVLEKKEQPKKPMKPKPDSPMMHYINTQVQTLMQSVMSIITKAAPILSEDSFKDMLPVAWELLLENDQELAAAAASVFLVSAVKAADQAQEMMYKELQHEHVTTRINAILRFGALWRFRYQVWPRLEDGANMYIKVPPPSIDFVLPSPTIGLPSLPVVDPPWMPHFKAKVEEVTINQEESKTFVTATTTRRKQQQEMIHRALLAEEDRRRAAREGFLVTAIPVTHAAAYEPALHHASEEHEEALQEEINLAARRMSVAPINRASNVQHRNLSWRHSSMFWPRANLFQGEEERVEHVHHMQLAQHFFPSCVCAAALPVISLLEDLEVNNDGVSVSEVAHKVIWSCLVEEPTLFLRTFLEKLTNKERKDELIYMLRKLLFHLPELPAQTAHVLFNYLVGFVMFYVRSPAEGGQESIGQALSILWQVVPSVHGIFFKDLKQTLRKEQCDPSLMVTANVPSAKKLIVHGPDQTSIPSQYPIHEDTQFASILQESLDFFDIAEDEHNSYFLVDTKTNQMHNLNSYVRDFYFFRRNFYPQLSLVHMNPDEASYTLQKQAFILKFVEMGKVLFTMSIIQGADNQLQLQNHVNFLQEELLKLPSFPRKALEAELGLYKGHWGKELFGVDMLHKYSWTKLMTKTFQSMSSTFTLAGDLPLFLNVVNGTLLLHCEDTAMLRLCIATFINASRHFKQVFSTSGFLYIMPSMLKVYSNHQSNPVLCAAIEFACCQFYTLHQKPFMLQMFGSIAPILNMNEDTTLFDYTKVDPRALFHLLLALEKDCPDNLDILEMVEGEKPLTALDFCYHCDSYSFHLIDAINMCVTVVAYACDSPRAMQMLTILEAILPCYLHYLKTKTCKNENQAQAREELIAIGNLAVSMRALVISAEVLTRNFSGPQRHFETVANSSKPMQNHNHSPQGPSIFYDEQSEVCYRYMEEGMHQRGRRHQPTAEEDADTTLNEFRRPRNSLLCIVAYFFSHCNNRLRELRRLIADPSTRMPELLDHKAHNRLADIAHTLLKVAPYDPATMACPGLQRYMLDILPITDWSNESIRPALNLIFRRLERCFTKIYKKYTLKKHLDWDAASNLLKGVSSTLGKYAYLAHLPHLKTLINVCLNVVLSEDCNITTCESLPIGTQQRHNSIREPPPLQEVAPPLFCFSVIKVTAMQMQALMDQYTLEHICGGMTVFPSPERTMNTLLNLILPLAIRMGCGRRDCPRMRSVDLNFALTVLLHALSPPSRQMAGSTSSSKMHGPNLPDGTRTASIRSHKHIQSLPKENLLNVVFMGLKIIVVCFEKQLHSEWYRISQAIQHIGNKLLGGVPLWRFLDFVVTYRTPLFMLLQPFIQYRMMKVMCETEAEYFLQHLVHQKLQGHSMPHPKCKGSVLVELAAELRLLKDELFLSTSETRATSPSATEPDVAHRRQSVMVRTSSVGDVLEQLMATKVNPTPNSIAPKKYTQGLLAPAGSTGLAPPPQGRGASLSPALQRKAGQRIVAIEGSRILEKYIAKPPVPEEEGEPEASYLQASSPRKLHRQASIYQRAHITKQQHVCGTPPEDNSPSSPWQPSDDSSDTDLSSSHQPAGFGSRLQRQSRIIHRGILRRQVSYCCHEPGLHSPLLRKLQTTAAPRHYRGLLEKQGHVTIADDPNHTSPVYLDDLDHCLLRERTDSILHSPSESEYSDACAERRCHPNAHNQAVTKSDASGSPSSPTQTSPEHVSQRSMPAAEGSADFDPRMHRLQRQDAKSRKTFKIKRHRSTIKGNIVRSSTVKGISTVKGSFHIKAAATRTPSNEPHFGSCDRLERLETQQEEPSEVSETEGGQPASEGAAAPKEAQAAVKPSCKRFIPRSKSHDDGTQPRSGGAGTVRGRIARQGARLVRSRSPSSSPVRRYTSPSLSPAQSQTYVNKCDSVESLNNEEHLALLQEEEKTKSQSSLVIFFDGTEMQDTCV